MALGEIFPLWRAAAEPHWSAFTRHRFVEMLADGTLPRAAFLHYLVQDYVFLVHFARAWALAITKADTLAEMRQCAATVHALLEDEMRLHLEICAAEGVDEAMLFGAEERTENLAYTRYVLDAGHSGDFLDLLAALAPCVLGYGEIGARLLAEAADTPYRAWIETYGGPDYQEMCAEVGRLIDGAAARQLGSVPAHSPRWASVCARFRTATRLEVGFWDMGLSP